MFKYTCQVNSYYIFFIFQINKWFGRLYNILQKKKMSTAIEQQKAIMIDLKKYLE